MGLVKVLKLISITRVARSDKNGTRDSHLPYYTKLTWVPFNIRFINVDLINVFSAKIAFWCTLINVYFLEKR